jgi:predicted DNA-binding protein (MmcQ/YjbR family)
MPVSPIARLRKLCLALPEAHEVEAWGTPTFRVRNKIFAMYARANSHHGGGRNATWLKAAPGDQAKMVAAAPECFFSPPYVGPSGWIGVWLDGVVEWEDVAEFVRDSYRLVAPKKLGALLDSEKRVEPPASKASPRKRRSNRA